MEEEVVRRRRWLTQDEFLDLLGATNLIPGPNSTELAIHIGHRQAGWPGLLVAGASFILPAVLIVLAFAWAYVRYGSLPQVAGVLYGVKPVIIVIVLQAFLPARIEALKKAGLHFRNEMESGPGGKQIQLEDPDGNPIELFEPAAR
jgi:chromate transport protein ChrA